jgi:hypothetical protein
VVSTFRFDSADVAVAVEGPEEFVREHLRFLAPFVGRAAGLPAAAVPPPPGASPAPGLDGVGAWWFARVPPGTRPSLQDTILLFAYFMRSYRKTVFLSEDIRACFRRIGGEEPRSLLQILGNLKRDQGLLLNAGKRGEYMMNTTGIARARALLGERRADGPADGTAGGPITLDAPASKADARSLFKD